MDDATRSQLSSLRLISSAVVTAAVFLIAAAAVVVGWTLVPEFMCRTEPREDEGQAICGMFWALIGSQVVAFTGGVLAGLLRPSWLRLGAAMAGAVAGVLEVGVEYDLLSAIFAMPFFGGIALAVGYGFGAVIEHGVRHPDT